jgi:hypothetical protein
LFPYTKLFCAAYTYLGVGTSTVIVGLGDRLISIGILECLIGLARICSECSELSIEFCIEDYLFIPLLTIDSLILSSCIFYAFLLLRSESINSVSDCSCIGSILKASFCTD